VNCNTTHYRASEL